MIQLDTGFLIRALNSGSPEDRKLRDWIGAGETLSMSAVAWAEFLCGPLDGSELALAAQIVGEHRDFTSDHATIAAQLFNGTGRRGSLIDCMIAAAALADGASIATENVADFRRFEHFGLKVV
ncbi:MAG: PIN domain-containing protein [Truepera sp.]|nr:PIN domain-containing protein [Truepera sp.]